MTHAVNKCFQVFVSAYRHGGGKIFVGMQLVVVVFPPPGRMGGLTEQAGQHAALHVFHALRVLDNLLVAALKNGRARDVRFIFFFR